MKTAAPANLYQLSGNRTLAERHVGDEAFATLRQVAARYWFTAEEHDDDTVTLRGPTYQGANCQRGGALNLRLARDVAKVRLLSEVCCAMAESTSIFNTLDNPLDLPFVINKERLVDTAARWRILHEETYRALGEAQVKLYGPAVPITTQPATPQQNGD